MTEDAIIDGVLSREKGFVHHKSDRGGPTNHGITAKTLGAWRKLGRLATVEEVRTLSAEEARAIYRQIYIVAPGFDTIADAPLRAQVIDDGVLSGPLEATKTLQKALGLRVDGAFGVRTRAALAAADPVAIHVRVLKDRLLRYATIVRDNRSQGDFILGWVSRALDFLDDHGRPRA